MVKPSLWVDYGDCHFPEIHWPTFSALTHFLRDNPVDGFVFGGDQFDNSSSISHWTKGKPRLRYQGAYKKEERDFDNRVLKPLEALLPKSAKRVWVSGNHDFFEEHLVDEAPEMDGIQRRWSLNLEERGWQFIECGKHFRIGKLTIIHGDQLASAGYITGNHSKKALEIYGQNVLYHHIHTPQSATKIMPFDTDQKYMAWSSPAGCTKNPHYLRNRATSWLNGFNIITFFGNGLFNLYPVIISRGQFSYGGRIYGSAKGR